jgi:hypothetical protein
MFQNKTANIPSRTHPKIETTTSDHVRILSTPFEIKTARIISEASARSPLEVWKDDLLTISHNRRDM